MNILEKTFTRPIEKFFLDIKKCNWDFMEGVIFFRDFYYLPHRSPHDIDIIADRTKFELFFDELKKNATKHDLFLYRRLNKSNAHILIFDLKAENKGRSWVYFEIRDKININDKISIFSKDIETFYSKNFGFRIPKKNWLCFFEIFQGVRTNNLKKSNQNLKKLNINLNTSVPLFKKYLNINVDFLDDYKNSIDLLRENITLRSQKIKTSYSTKTKINRFLTKHFYFYHLSKPIIFSINGPDGVGKTTTILEIKKIFKKLPIGFETHHHITGWKHNKQILTKRNSKNFESPSLIHIFLRLIYRNLLSENLRYNYVLMTGYHNYLSQLNKLIFSLYLKNKVILLDRYIYDLIIKNKFNKKGYNLIHNLFMKLSKKMKIIYNLYDKPKNIIKRKQELSLDQIRIYQESILKLANNNNLNIKNLNVEGKKPSVIAETIVKDMLLEIKDELFILFKSFKSK